MNEKGTINDAAAIFSALRGDQVIELLSRLETDVAQRLLATAAARNLNDGDLERASDRLERELNRTGIQRQTPIAHTNSNKASSEQKKHRRGRKRNRKPGANRSLDFLIDMPSHDIQLLLSKVSTACWAPALKTASSSVREVIFENVAPAIERILRQEIESFDGNDQVARISRRKIVDAFNDLPPSESRQQQRKAG